MAVRPASTPEIAVTSATDPQNASGTAAWTVVLAIATAVGTLATACMMPFVALATVTAATMSRPRAGATIGGAWALNQVIGFTLLGYPPTATAFGWGLALFAASLFAMLVAGRVLDPPGPIGLRLAPAFLAAFATYELGLFGFASLVGGTETFTAPIVADILLNDAGWFAALLAAHALLTRTAPRAFGPGLRLRLA